MSNIIDTKILIIMQLMMAVLRFPYSLFSKQERKIQVAPFTININEIYYLRKMSHTSMSMGIMACSYDTSFLVRILIIRDGDVESNPGPNDIDFSIKKQETGNKQESLESLRADQRNLI